MIAANSRFLPKKDTARRAGPARILAMLPVVLIGGAPVAQASPPAAPLPASGPANPAPSPQQIAALVQIMLATLQGSGANGRVGDLEARLTFAIDQAQVTCSISQAALVQVEGTSGSLTPTARLALRHVRDSLLRCQTTGTGTTALRGTQSTLAQGTTLGLAGGSSNYQTAK